MMSNGAYSPKPTLQWEEVGQEVLVFDTQTSTSHHLTGRHATVFLSVVRGKDTGLDKEIIRDLIDAGLISRAGVSGHLTRRRVVAGITAGATIGALSFPTAAMASSSNSPTLITADVTLANWRIDSYGTGFFLLNTTTLDQAGLSDIFEVGDVWEVEILDFGTDLRESATVTLTAGVRRLNFTFDPETPPSGTVTAQLRSSAKNLISSSFAVPLLPPPP